VDVKAEAVETADARSIKSSDKDYQPELSDSQPLPIGSETVILPCLQSSQASTRHYRQGSALCARYKSGASRSRINLGGSALRNTAFGLSSPDLNLTVILVEHSLLGYWWRCWLHASGRFASIAALPGFLSC
jgi:hypothetical protein